MSRKTLSDERSPVPGVSRAVTQRILLIQDDPHDAEAIRDALSHPNDGSFDVEWIRHCAAGVERLVREARQDGSGTQGIAAVLVDLSLPDSDGLETFDRLFRAAPQIPILIVVGAHDEDIAKLAVQNGAQDYLLKTRVDSYTLPKSLGNMIERALISEALFEEKERAQITLNSIGDAVMSIDVRGGVTYLNPAAERMTGWSWHVAAGRPVEEVFRAVDAATRAPVENPMMLAIRENRTVALTPNCLLIRRDGAEVGIEDSAAPIHDRRGQVTGAVMVFHDVTRARALALQMAHLAQHDSLTDLPNRALLQDRLTQAVALAHRRQQKLALLFLDVDRFKHINDSFGHAVGDRLLKSVAHRLLGSVRSSDTVSRQGGDEFVILLTEITQAQDAVAFAEKISLALSAPHRIDSHELHVTVSIGIVTYPDDGMEAETLLKNADAAMYRAKDSGRNTYQFFGVKAVARGSATLSGRP